MSATDGGPLADGAAGLASIGQRVVARLLDGLVFLLPVLAVVVRWSRVEGGELVLDVPLWATLALVGANGAYEVGFVAWRGQTLGKMALRIKVVRVDGGPVGPSRAAIRALVPMATGAVPTLFGPALSVVVYGWAVADPHRQGLHDKAAGTLVVRV